MKRVREEAQEPEERPRKIVRAPQIDRLSRLSDELLVRILSFGSVSTLLTCQRVSRKFSRLCTDSQLWKALYYNTFVRPRASRISGIRNAANAEASERLCYSSKLSKWLEDGHLVKKGPKTNWKQQYRLRHNWSLGQCAVSEIVVAERPPEPPLLVMMHNGMVFTADSISGLRVWKANGERELIASAPLVEPGINMQLPTSMAIDSSDGRHKVERVAVGFEDGSFAIYALQTESKTLVSLFRHPASSNGMLSALAYSSPYLLTMTGDHVVSLYSFAESKATELQLDAPKLLYSLRSHTAWPPVSLSVRTNASNMTAAIAYALPTYLSGWTVGIQEMRLSHTGELIESRLATAVVADEHFSSLPRTHTTASSSPSPKGPSPMPPSKSKPTSMSYSHPYLLAAHPDNTLTLYLVRSTLTSLFISAGTRLWGHTSSVSGAHVGMRGKAVSVSRLGDELRVWDLEGGIASSAARKSSGISRDELSVRVQPARTPVLLEGSDEGGSSGDESSGDSGRKSGFVDGQSLKFALAQRFDDETVSQGWVGFDEQNVIVLKEKKEGRQALVVYDFT